ncbi:MAG TPA: ABATE domain-containing protein [Longimicrobium sp.]|nr:ABATE domain-containing protein [Longimicrobium sp.]
MSQSTDAPPFAFLAGSLCLDFANTAFREEGVVVWESLHDFGDLASWGDAARVLMPEEADRLRALAGERPGDASDSLARAVAAREQVYRVFAAIAERRPVDPGDLAGLDRAQRDAFAHRRLAAEDGGFAWTWTAGEPALDRVLWRVAESAAELLTRGDLGRVRRCQGEDCTRLFLDNTKNGRRRWCDMSHCGNIAKVRRYRSRRRSVPGAPG